MRGLVAGVSWGLLALLAGVEAAVAQPLFTPGQDPAAGARLFIDKRCETCHAINGKGGRVGPDLGTTARPRTFYDLAAGLWNHAPTMASRMREMGIARPTLTPQESADLAGYLFTVSYFDRPGNADAGRRLFTSKQCVSCHQVAGRGGAVGPPLDRLKTYASPIGLAAAMWNHGVAMTGTMEQKGVTRPTFNARELIDLIAFINRASPTAPIGPLYVLPGRAAEGGRLLIDKRCVECHSISGKGEGALNLVDRGANKSLTEFAAGMWNKLPAMTGQMRKRSITVPALRPEEMADIVAYLYSVRYFAAGGDSRNGVILATYKGCLTCHGLYSEPGKPASDLTRSQAIVTPPGSLSALWNHSFIADPRPAPQQTPWPTFTGREMADLMTYLGSLKRTP